MKKSGEESGENKVCVKYWSHDSSGRLKPITTMGEIRNCAIYTSDRLVMDGNSHLVLNMWEVGTRAVEPCDKTCIEVLILRAGGGRGHNPKLWRFQNCNRF